MKWNDFELQLTKAVEEVSKKAGIAYLLEPYHITTAVILITVVMQSNFSPDNAL